MPGSTSTHKAPERVARDPAPVISFVSFDGSSSSDASRKAVRKQAALASAAARKATIAKKNAKQKEQSNAGAKREDNSSALSTEGHREGIKRKRSDDSDSDKRPWQAGVSIIASSPVPRSDGLDDTTQPIQSGPRSYGDQMSSRKSDVRMPSCSAVQHPGLTRNSYFEALSPSPEPLLRTGDESHLKRSPVPLPRFDAAVPQASFQEMSPFRRFAWGDASDDFSHDHDDQLECHLPITPESLASPQTHSASIVDPFNQYPVPYHPLYDRLLHHMMTIFAPRGWSSIKITNDEGVAWETFMTQHALAEPALFLVRLLFASGDLIRVGVLDPNVAIALRQLAIQAINEALSDPERCISDGLILAVGRIALNETLYGDKSAASLHRPAQRRMITLRGGMHALDFPPLVKRLMRWSDRVMSIHTNTPRLILDEEDGGNTTLTMNESLNLVEDWVPVEAQAMRKKIAIADLIS